MSAIGSIFTGGIGADSWTGQGADAASTSQSTQNITGIAGQQQAFLGQLAAQGGAQNQSNVFQQQQQLAQQLQQQAAGGGPNPAMAQLQQTTGQNVASQASLAAGQRGAGANAGLMARQVGQQGAATQQQAVGQGATMAAEQQLNAQHALQNQQANMANLSTQQVGQQAGVMQQLAGNQQGLLNSQYSSLNNQNNVNATIAQGNQAQQQSTFNNMTPAMSSMSSMLAEGGEVEAPMAAPVAVQDPGAMGGPRSQTAQILSNPVSDTGSSVNPLAQAKMQAAQAKADGDSGGGGGGLGGILAMLHKGGKVPALVSPGEVYIPPSKVKAAEQAPDATKVGQKVPGRAKVKGNSFKNDTVKATLEEGGIVLPKSVMESKHPAWAAHKFITAINAKSKLRKK